jgi:hypothetical protein
MPRGSLLDATDGGLDSHRAALQTDSARRSSATGKRVSRLRRWRRRALAHFAA